MSPQFRVFLIAAAALGFVYVFYKIRKADIRISESTFWFLFSASFLVMAVFPPVVFFFAGLFSIQSPVNFVYLYVIGMLVLRTFMMTSEISQLRNRVAALTQSIALERGESGGPDDAADDGRDG